MGCARKRSNPEIIDNIMETYFDAFGNKLVVNGYVSTIHSKGIYKIVRFEVGRKFEPIAIISICNHSPGIAYLRALTDEEAILALLSL